MQGKSRTRNKSRTHKKTPSGEDPKDLGFGRLEPEEIERKIKQFLVYIKKSIKKWG